MKIVSIGRAQDNELVVSAPDVSGHHACMTIGEDGNVMIRDVGSTNGTFVNGIRISGDTLVRPGDRVMLGKTVLDVSRYFSAHRPPVMDNKPSHGTIRAESRGTMVANVANGVTIGRSSDNMVVVSYGDVSSHHAVLQQSPSGDVTIVDNNSTNGTYVNGHKVNSCVLKRGDKVMLANRYPLDWEHYIKGKPARKKKNIALISGIVAGVVVLAALCVWLIMPDRSLSEKELYAKYNSSVVMVLHSYTYKVEIKGIDDAAVIELLGTNMFGVSDNKLVPNGVMTISGTGFFISEDGKLATNLHVAQPWLFSDDVSNLEQLIRKCLVGIGGTAYLTEVKVKGVTQMLGVLPNGLPVSETNLTTCREYKASNTVEKDVAILQTDIYTLPNKVQSYFDLTKADLSDKALQPGEKIYYIGYPLGLSEATVTTDNMEIHNQIQAGSVTQVRDENTFGHNCASIGGASGSPIFNDRGRLVGVLNAGVSGTQGFNQGIKAKHLLELYNR